MTQKCRWKEVFSSHYQPEDTLAFDSGGVFWQLRHLEWDPVAYENFLVDLEKFVNSNPKEFKQLLGMLWNIPMWCLTYRDQMIEYKDLKDCPTMTDIWKMTDLINTLFLHFPNKS